MYVRKHDSSTGGTIAKLVCFFRSLPALKKDVTDSIAGRITETLTYSYVSPLKGEDYACEWSSDGKGA